METIFLIAAALSAITFSISITSIFKGFRELVSKIHPKVEELIHCPWCLSHWILAVFMISSITGFYRPEHITGILAFDYIITSFSIIFISGLGHFILLRTYEPVAKLMVQRQMEKLKKES